jgi:hypothetical protein
MVHSPPFTVHCPLFTVQCFLPTAHCPLPIAHCPLPTAHCPLSTAHCPLPVRSSLFIVHCHVCLTKSIYPWRSYQWWYTLGWPNDCPKQTIEEALKGSPLLLGGPVLPTSSVSGCCTNCNFGHMARTEQRQHLSAMIHALKSNVLISLITL